MLRVKGSPFKSVEIRGKYTSYTAQGSDHQSTVRRFLCEEESNVSYFCLFCVTVTVKHKLSLSTVANG